MLGAVLVHDARDRLEPLLFGQLVLVVLELLLAAAFALDRVVGIVAVVEIAGTVVDLDHAVAALVDEPAVMGNDHDRTAVGLKVISQPVDRVHIQVVGRLVEQQDVGLFQNDAREVDARLLAAREQGEPLRAHALRDIQTVAHAIDLKIAVVPAEDLQPGLELCISLEQRGVIRLARHLVGERIHGGGDLVRLAERQPQHVLDRGVVREIRHLVDHARVFPRAERNMPAVVRQAAGQDVQQGGFARAVRAQNGNLFARLDVK